MNKQDLSGSTRPAEPPVSEGSEPATFDLAAVDVDGAVRETAAETIDVLESQDDTRAAFLRKAGLASGAFVGGGAMLGALAPAALGYSTGDRPPSKIFGTGDIAILNFALVLEYLESDFYNEALSYQRKTGFIKNPQTVAFLRAVAQDEQAHVALLRAALGQAQIKSPKFDYHGDNKDEGKFVAASDAFENEGVHAYLGQAFNLKSPKLLNVAATIVTVEARHAGVIGLIHRGTARSIAPFGPRDQPRGASRVIKDVGKLNYITKLYKAPKHT
jgi:rubrerythrin